MTTALSKLLITLWRNSEMYLNANCKPFGIGSLPYIDGHTAWRAVLRNFHEFPFWPQLPKRDYRENMYAQFSEGLPGVVIDTVHERIFVNTEDKMQQNIESFYTDYLSEDLAKFKITRDYCEGIYSGLDLINDEPSLFNDTEYIKGQITGPVSSGLQIIDQYQKPILYDDMLHDVLVKNLQRKAKWQEETLKVFGKNIIISVDEPYLSTLGSGFMNLKRDNVIEDLEAIFSELTCLKAMHCCGNTDWSLITETSIDILLFDAFDYINNLVLFSSEIKEFLDSGGILGWGIVPTTTEALANINLDILIKKLENGIETLLKKGIDKELLLKNSLITPSCGLGNLSIEHAELAMEYTKQISEYLNRTI